MWPRLPASTRPRASTPSSTDMPSSVVCLRRRASRSPLSWSCKSPALSICLHTTENQMLTNTSAGNGSIDDPDASYMYDLTMTQIEDQYPELAADISVMRLDPNDQLLNMLIANAEVVLQLSTREGFEVK